MGGQALAIYYSGFQPPSVHASLISLGQIAPNEHVWGSLKRAQQLNYPKPDSTVYKGQTTM